MTLFRPKTNVKLKTNLEASPDLGSTIKAASTGNPDFRNICQSRRNKLGRG